MRKPEQAPEPSIEEILASIRRIIADDAPPAEQGIEESAVRLHTAPAAPRTRPAEPGLRAVEGRSREDEVLELTEDYMLGEEAASMRLQEPAEPAEMQSDSFDDPFTQKSSFTAKDFDFNSDKSFDDPYSDPGSAAQPQDAQPAPAPAASAPERADQATASNGLASVMAEVQRFVDVGKAAEAPSKPAARPLDNWVQPQNEVFKSDPAPRPAARWSARQKSADVGKGPEVPASRPAAPAREQGAPSRGLGLGNREDWSQGIQMPVPDEGPAIPFADEALDLPHPVVSAEQKADIQAEAEAAAPAPKPAIPDFPLAGLAQAAAESIADDVQQRAEKLAERVVADFASDKLASPPVADFLKADRPLMASITDKLADALTKAGDPAQEANEAAPPIEDFAEDHAASDLPPVAFGEPMESELPIAAEAPRLDIGFIPPMPSAAPQPRPAAFADHEAPELPREDADEIVAAMPPKPARSAAAQAPARGMEPPAMPQQMPAAPSFMVPRPAAGSNAMREPDMGMGRLQPTAASSGLPRTLEDTVRDMLRPLLVQWLNENMPRILNEALREEMAAAGMIPSRRDSERR